MKTGLLPFLFLLMVALGFSACSPQLSPFTQRLYEEQQWTPDELRRIQFYLSDDLVLYRELTGAKSEIVQGEIKVVNGRQREQVTIRRGTPGVFLFTPKEDRFAVAFEEGEDRYLVFGPSPKYGNRYVLLASDWSQNRGIVTYGDQKWNVDASDAFAALLVDLKRLQSTEVNQRVAGGRRIN